VVELARLFGAALVVDLVYLMIELAVMTAQPAALDPDRLQGFAAEVVYYNLTLPGPEGLFYCCVC